MDQLISTLINSRVLLILRSHQSPLIGGVMKRCVTCGVEKLETVKLVSGSNTGVKSSGKIPVALGSGVMVTRHTLDVKFGVRVPTPQLEKA
jgi:hypothetical protein